MSHDLIFRIILVLLAVIFVGITFIFTFKLKRPEWLLSIPISLIFVLLFLNLYPDQYIKENCVVKINDSCEVRLIRSESQLHWESCERTGVDFRFTEGDIRRFNKDLEDRGYRFADLQQFKTLHENGSLVSIFLLRLANPYVVEVVDSKELEIFADLVYRPFSDGNIILNQIDKGDWIVVIKMEGDKNDVKK